MKLLIFIVFLFIACGRDSQTIFRAVDGKDGSSCSVQRISNGSKITCTDGTYSFVYDGSNGSSCSVTGNSNGAQVNCTDGSSNQINNGQDGANGLSGASCTVAQVSGGVEVTCGSNTEFVANGTNATSITIVQFCPNFQTTYPSTFAEVGICVGGQILAVYWDKTNAWLSSIPQGYYSSTSTSAPCNFTVLPNCQIQN
jgi:hypothetical protein